MQSSTQDGRGNVAVQIAGDGNTVSVSCGGIVLHLLAKHARRREVRSDLDLLRPETQLLDLLGREDEMASLLGWLDDPRPVLTRGVTGRAGSGKTRLAIELCEAAAKHGWRAGFLDSGDLARFVEAERTAEWPRDVPLLVVVDLRRPPCPLAQRVAPRPCPARRRREAAPAPAAAGTPREPG